MSGSRHRVLVGGVLAAALTVSLAAWQGAAGAATGPPKSPHANCPDSGPGKQGMPPEKGKPAEPVKPSDHGKPGKAGDSGKAQGGLDLKALAHKFGLSVARLEAGLVAVKCSGTTGPAAVTVFAKAAKVSQTVAAQIVKTVFTKAAPGEAADQDAFARGLAKALSLDLKVAARAVDRLFAMGSIDPTSAAFAAVAHDLGVTPGKLAAALDDVKQQGGR